MKREKRSTLSSTSKHGSQRRESLDLVLFSDSHELHRDEALEVPPGDILICCGDFTMLSRSLAAIEDFDEWLGELPHRHVLVVPGNHEFFLEADPIRRSLLSNAKVLIDESITIHGLVFYGSPVTPLYGGAFRISSPLDRKKHWNKIPENTNVLITHGPPYGVLDQSPGQQEHTGDPELLERISELQSLRLHCLGHVHGGYGRIERNDVTFCNVALLGGDGGIAHPPIVLKMQRSG